MAMGGSWSERRASVKSLKGGDESNNVHKKRGGAQTVRSAEQTSLFFSKT